MSRGKGGLARAVTPLLHKASQESAAPLPDAFVFESVDGPRILDIPADVVPWTSQISPTGGRLQWNCFWGISWHHRAVGFAQGWSCD